MTERPPEKLWRSYFNEPSLSDLTIKFSGEQVYVHRIVLCRSSEYFEKLVNGHFMESHSKEIEIHEDQPRAVMAMLRFIYDLPLVDEPQKEDHNALLYAQIFVVAEKYGLDRLECEASQTMRNILEQHKYRVTPDFNKIAQEREVESADFINKPHLQDLIETVGAIYENTSTPNKATALIVNHTLEHMARLRDVGDFQALLYGTATFAADLLVHNSLSHALTPATSPLAEPDEPESSMLWRNHFNDPALSDLTLKFGNEEDEQKIHVHRVVLSGASQYFDTLITGHFKENGAKEITLHDDDPEALMVVLRMAYGLSYKLPTKDHEALPHAQVYVTACKYGLERFCAGVCKSMRSAFDEHIYCRDLDDDHPHKNDRTDLVEAIKTVYNCTPVPNGASQTVLDHCIDNLAMVLGVPEFSAALPSLGVLSADILLHRDLGQAVHMNMRWSCGNDRCPCDAALCYGCRKAITPVYAWLKRHQERMGYCQYCNSWVILRCAQSKDRVKAWDVSQDWRYQ